MNKKGALSSTFWIVIGIIIFVGFVLFLMPRITTVCTLLDTGHLTKPVAQAPTQGAIFIWYDIFQKNYLDPSFQYLFGATFFNSIKFIAGYKGVCDSIFSFENHFILALLALLWIALGKFLINMLVKVFRIGRTGGSGYWAHVGASTYLASVKTIGLLVIYPTLMQIAVVNRFIEIVTFYYFTNWLMYSFILAIYVGWLPEIIKSLIYYREYQRAQKAIFLMKTGTTKIQTAGKTNP